MKLNGPNIVLKQSEEGNVSEFLPSRTFSFSLFLIEIDDSLLSSLSNLPFFYHNRISLAHNVGWQVEIIDLAMRAPMKSALKKQLTHTLTSLWLV